MKNRKVGIIMPFSISLETEDNEVVGSQFEDENLLTEVLPETGDRSFCCVRYIDPYGITVFNRLQMDDFISEIRLLKAKSQNKKLHSIMDKILMSAEQCRDEVHLYLKFYGD